MFANVRFENTDIFAKSNTFTNTKRSNFFMDNKTFYYARVSTREQNLDRQIAPLRN